MDCRQYTTMSIDNPLSNAFDRKGVQVFVVYGLCLFIFSVFISPNSPFKNAVKIQTLNSIERIFCDFRINNSDSSSIFRDFMGFY